MWLHLGVVWVSNNYWHVTVVWAEHNVAHVAGTLRCERALINFINQTLTSILFRRRSSWTCVIFLLCIFIVHSNDFFYRLFVVNCKLRLAPFQRSLWRSNKKIMNVNWSIITILYYYLLNYWTVSNYEVFFTMNGSRNLCNE